MNATDDGWVRSEGGGIDGGGRLRGQVNRRRLVAVLGRAAALVAASLCLVHLNLSPAHAQTPSGPVCGTYEYIYPHNTVLLTENHFIVLDCSDGSARGWYYGTSDDFDQGREGYPPGFFVAEMEGLAVAARQIQFTLLVGEDEYFTEPVPLAYRNRLEVPTTHFEPWGYGARTERRLYQGFFEADSIVLDVEGGRRVFRRSERE